MDLAFLVVMMVLVAVARAPATALVCDQIHTEQLLLSFDTYLFMLNNEFCVRVCFWGRQRTQHCAATAAAATTCCRKSPKSVAKAPASRVPRLSYKTLNTGHV